MNSISGIIDRNLVLLGIYTTLIEAGIKFNPGSFQYHAFLFL
jgi:hypothetical protein